MMASTMGSVWAELNDEALFIDKEELKRLFAEKPDTTAAIATPQTSSITPLIAQQNAKRGQNLAIMLKNVKRDYDGVTAAILAGDEEFLDETTTTVLLKCVPSLDEIEMVQECQDSRMIGPVERFFAAVGVISNLEGRLESWLFRLQFQQRHQVIENNILRLVEATRAVRESSAFRDFLSLTLAIGNYLNAGYPARGQAYGFDLATLKKLRSTRATTGNSNVLAYITCRLSPETRSRLVKDLAAVESGRSVDVSAMNSDLSELGKSVVALRETLTGCPADEGYVTKMVVFQSIAEPKMTQLRESVKAAYEGFDGLLRYLAVVPKMTPAELFGILFEFLQEFRQEAKI